MPFPRPVTNRGLMIVLGLAMLAAIGITADTAVDFTTRRDRIDYALGAGNSAMLESKLGGVGDAPLVRIASSQPPSADR